MSISPWSLSKIHSNKQKLLRRRTTRRHRYTALLLPLLRDVFIWECWLILGAWVSFGWRRVAEPFFYCTGDMSRPVRPKTICLGFFALCLSSALQFFACCAFDLSPRVLSHTPLIFRSWTYLMIQMASFFFFLPMGWGRGRCQSHVSTRCESQYSVFFLSQLQQHRSDTRRDHKFYHSPDKWSIVLDKCIRSPPSGRLMPAEMTKCNSVSFLNSCNQVGPFALIGMSNCSLFVFFYLRFKIIIDNDRIYNYIFLNFICTWAQF